MDPLFKVSIVILRFSKKPRREDGAELSSNHLY